MAVTLPSHKDVMTAQCLLYRYRSAFAIVLVHIVHHDTRIGRDAAFEVVIVAHRVRDILVAERVLKSSTA